jgi:hypothetical protein
MTDLDEVLERFHMGCCEYGPGLANHGPMAAEAMVELGHGSLLTGLVDLYAPRLPPFETGEALAANALSAALGDIERTADWVATYELQLAGAGWQEVLGRALRDLAPGTFAAAAHGLLRVAHAVRALERESSPARVRELAFGLGYWAARYQVLPGDPGARGERDAIDVMRAFQPVPPKQRKPGLFTDAALALDDYAPFAEAVEVADLSKAGSSEFISALCAESARLYLANPMSRIAYAHAVTAPSALRLVLNYADEETRGVLGAVGFQSTLALHAIACSNFDSLGGNVEDLELDDEVLRLAEDPAETRYRAACSLREHSIKLTEACLREHAVSPAPVFALAAADAAVHLESSGAAWG